MGRDGHMVQRSATSKSIQLLVALFKVSKEQQAGLATSCPDAVACHHAAAHLIGGGRCCLWRQERGRQRQR